MTLINVQDESTPEDILKKTKPWFNGAHTFPTVKIETKEQPTSLGINVSDGAKPGEKIG
jgi:hypothetical protein